jgi:hypothetical protein
MGGVSFYRLSPVSCLIHTEGYAAFFMPPIHNFRLYLKQLSLMTLTREALLMNRDYTDVMLLGGTG